MSRYIYLRATDPSAPVEARVFGDKGWEVFVLERKPAGGLLKLFADFLTEQKINPSDLGALFVFMGKGSFTATRTAATVANTLAFALNIKVAGVSAFSGENPEALLSAAGKNKYLTPSYSAPARIGK